MSPCFALSSYFGNGGYRNEATRNLKKKLNISKY